jgi:hypothetical protein
LATLGEKTYEFWKNFNNFVRKSLKNTIFTPYGTTVLTVTKSNKRATWKANGLGGFMPIPDIEKIWPDKDEIEDSPPTDVNILIETSIVSIGTKIVRKKYLGLSATSFTSEDRYTYVPSGTIVMSTSTTRWRSDGLGGVNSEAIDDGDGGGGDDNDDNNPDEGTNLGPDSDDPCYDRIANGSGGYTLQSNGSCDDDDNDHPTAGTDLGVDPNDACYNLIADGMGGSTQQSNGSCDGDGGGGDNGGGGDDNGGGGGEEHPPAGTNLGPNPLDSCDDRIADGMGGFTLEDNGTCTEGGGGDGDTGGGGGGGGGGGEEGEERTDEDPLHSDNGQFSDYLIAANWDGGHPYNANGELHMVKLDPVDGIWVLDPAV